MANLKFKRNDRVRVIIGGKEGVILNDSPKYIDEVRRKLYPSGKVVKEMEIRWWEVILDEGVSEELFDEDKLEKI